MKIPMRIENGKLVPPSEVRFLPDCTEVVVELPYDSLELPPSVARKQLEAILGRYARCRAAHGPENDKLRWHEHLKEEYRE